MLEGHQGECKESCARNGIILPKARGFQRKTTYITNDFFHICLRQTAQCLRFVLNPPWQLSNAVMARHRRGLRASNIDWSAFGFTIVQWSADGKGWRFTTLGYLKAISSINPLLLASQYATNNITIDFTASWNHWLERPVGKTFKKGTLSDKLSSLEFPFSFWLFLLVWERLHWYHLPQCLWQ